MTNTRKKRMSMLDSLAAAGGGAGTADTSMMSANRALRSARDAVDAHHVWELDPAVILDNRPHDRLDPDDVQDLRDAIETNGQTVPILVRRDPSDAGRYLLVYGRRRLEAIRLSDKVQKVRALVASLDDDSALRAQISENMARRDLSFIEKALFAQELVSSGFGNQSQVAEVLTVGKSAISMALAVVDMVTPDLVRAIGPAHGIGRPRWEALGKAIEASGANPERLAQVATEARDASALAVLEGDVDDEADNSVAAFEAVERLVARPSPAPAKPKAARAVTRPLTIGGTKGGSVKRTDKSVTITLDDGAFAHWVEAEAQDLIAELHARWLQRSED